MNTERIREIQNETGLPQSLSIQQALLKVWNETERDMQAIQVQAKVKPEIAELKKKIEGYKKIVQFILDNHWKFGDMEQQLLTKIEKIGIKYSL